MLQDLRPSIQSKQRYHGFSGGMSQANYSVILLLAFISGITTLIGVILAIHTARKPKSIAFGMGFSTGIMLLIALVELLPAAMTSSGSVQAMLGFVVGAGVLALLHWLIPHTHLFKETGQFNIRMVRSAYLVALGLILHDFPEGFAMANSFLTSPSLGLLVALAIALHNIPEEYAIAAPMASLDKKTTLYQIAFVSSLAEPLGAALGLYAAYLNATLIPLFLSFAAGAMVFVSLHELVPMARRYGYAQWFLSGVVISLLVHIGLNRLVPE